MNASTALLSAEQEELLDWDVPMIRAANPKRGTVKVRLRFAGRREPSPCEDPWAKDDEK